MRAIVAALVLATLVPACAEFNQFEKSIGGGTVAPPKPPAITVSSVALLTHPAPVDVAKALCPRVAPAPVCMLLGAPRSIDFVFDVQLALQNDNDLPLPVVEALVAFTAFPTAAGGRNLGAVCLSMCDDPAQCAPRADACTAGGPGIRTLADFGAAAAGFLIAVAEGQAKLDNLRVKTIPAHGNARIDTQLRLDAPQLLDLMTRAAQDVVAEVKRGQVPSFTIPYRVEGTAWMNVTGFGKLAAPFGPFSSSWRL